MVPVEHADVQCAQRLKSLVLPAHLSTARPKRLRFAVFTIAGRLISHAGKLILRIGHKAEQIAGLIAARARLGTLAATFG